MRFPRMVNRLLGRQSEPQRVSFKLGSHTWRLSVDEVHVLAVLDQYKIFDAAEQILNQTSSSAKEVLCAKANSWHADRFDALFGFGSQYHARYVGVPRWAFSRWSKSARFGVLREKYEGQRFVTRAPSHPFWKVGQDNDLLSEVCKSFPTKPLREVSLIEILRGGDPRYRVQYIRLQALLEFAEIVRRSQKWVEGNHGKV